MSVGKIRSLPPKGNTLSLRFEDLQGKIRMLFEHLSLGSSDVVLCEAETTMKDPRAAFRVERVRGIFETLARENQCKVPGRINPRTVHFEVMGLSGKQLKREIVKDTAVRIANNLYGPNLQKFGLIEQNQTLKKHQDIVDAILVGHVGISRLRTAFKTGAKIDTLFS